MNLNNIAATLPKPDVDASRHSGQLKTLICDEIEQLGGRISFDHYMALALYRLGLGYYVSGAQIFGEGGDFITAPEITPLFSHCLARQAEQVLSAIGGGDVIEFGAGSGTMAVEILRELERLNCLPNRYCIIDVSPTLIERQKQRIEQELPHLRNRVHWLQELPDAIHGIVFGNEVIDAMPVHRVKFNQSGEHEELYVCQRDGVLAWEQGPLSSEQLASVATRIYQTCGEDMVNGYESEINLAGGKWLKMLSNSIEKGVVILIDYGFPRHEFYHPDRHQGTLMCHYQHHAHGDPLILPGLQDITSHVDFTLVAEDAVECGFSVAGYTNQATFLIGCGMEQMLNTLDPEDQENFFRVAQPVKKLIMPHEMGELFKVIGLSKNIDEALIGFSVMDYRGRL